MHTCMSEQRSEAEVTGLTGPGLAGFHPSPRSLNIPATPGVYGAVLS